MFREYFLLLLLGHILGDFYTQTSKIAEKKKDSFRWVFIHVFLYLLTVIGISIPVMSVNMLMLDIIASCFHLLIDAAKFLIIKNKEKEILYVFIIDQSLHLICLAGLSYIWAAGNIQIKEMPIMLDFFNTSAISETLVCNWILGLLIVHKPANIFIQNLITPYKPKTDNNEDKVPDNNVGRVIGTVERIIMLILIYVNQYSAIGLVLTAKSIARYDRITKDEKFAEYYLLGTLISTGIVIACAVLLFKG